MMADFGLLCNCVDGQKLVNHRDYLSLELVPSMDYEILDTICDSYIPLLAIAFFVGLVGRAVKASGERRFLIRVFVFFAGMILVSYGIMFLDNAMHIWPAFGLDYSTHTAVSLTFVLSICVLARQFWKVAVGSFVVYVLLMLYQQYHTLSDIASTMVPIASVALVFAKFLFLQTQDNKSINSQS
jgi:hypothetical protein